MEITREQALKLLLSNSSHERFQAARVLAKESKRSDLKELMRAKKHENDAFVLRWIEKAINYCNKETIEEVKEQAELVSNIDEYKAIKAQAIEWIAGMLLHEIGNKLGLVALSASQDIKNYDSSKTGKHISHLQNIFDGISALKQSASSPQLEEFDLYNLIVDISEIENQQAKVDFRYVGPQPFIILSGRNLMYLALINGIKNAIEAVNELKRDNNDSYVPEISIIWGETPIDYWVSVNDNGIGLPPNHENGFGITKSTKEGHAGLGLSIARQALETLNGNLTINNSRSSGVNYMIRWPRKL